MTADLAPFDFEGTTVRTLLIDGGPWFVAADVCAVLGIVNSRDAVSRLDDDEKGVGTTDTPGGTQQVKVVNEAGVYGLAWTSRKPNAAAFRRWIKHDVLPSIRSTGSYSVAPSFQIPQTMGDALRLAADEHDARVVAEAKVAELAPRAEVADRILDADGDLSVGDAAKALTRAGVQVGPQRLFTLLDRMGWTYRGGDSRWRVKQAAITSGHMSVLPSSHYHPRTGVLVLDPPQPRVTPKGLARLLADHGGSNARAS